MKVSTLVVLYITLTWVTGINLLLADSSSVGALVLYFQKVIMKLPFILDLVIIFSQNPPPHFHHIRMMTVC